jgi:DNA-binding transcriptional MerR regulator
LKIIQAALNPEERIWETTDSRFLNLESLVGQDLRLLGRFRESIKKLEPIMEHLPEGVDPGMVFETAACLVSCYNRLGEHHIAHNICTKTMARYEGTLTDDIPAIISIYTVLGETLSGLKRGKEALMWATKAMLGAQRLYGTQHRQTFIAMEWLTFHYANLKDIRKACDWQKKSVNCMKSSLGEYHPLTIEGEVRLMNIVAQRRSQLFSRRRIIGRRRELFEKLSQQFGERDCRTLDCHYFLAQDYVACTSFNKAKVLQEKLVEVMIEEFGNDDNRTTDARTELARTNKWIATRKAVYWWLPKYLLQ